MSTRGSRTGSLQTLYAGATERNRERQVSCFQRFLGAGAQRRRLQLAAGDAERQGLRRRVVKEVLLYPQQSGTLHIEQSSMTVVAQIVVQSRSHSQSLFDDFFGGQSVQEVRKNLSAAPVPVTVRDFPAGAPASFNGAVGQVPTQRQPRQADRNGQCFRYLSAQVVGKR